MPRNRRTRWEWTNLENGYGQVKLLSWKYFMDFVYQEMLDYEDYIWRGHRSENWGLEPTLDRLIKKARIPLSQQSRFRNSHLDRFKYAVRGRRGSNPPNIDNENEWWALGQHHGLATPLLDWTSSPFVAAYFAFINEGSNQTENRAVFALHKPSVEIKVLELLQLEKLSIAKEKKEKARNLLAQAIKDLSVKPQVIFIRPLSDENQRLVNQGGLFTRSPDEKPLETWVQENPCSGSGYTLMKILIPNNDREDCLRTLNRMNINHLTLFPDLYGATKYCNIFGDIKKY